MDKPRRRSKKLGINAVHAENEFFLNPHPDYPDKELSPEEMEKLMQEFPEDSIFQEISHYNLHMPMNGVDIIPERLSEPELRCISRILAQIEEETANAKIDHIQAVEKEEEKVENPEILAYREKIHKEFDDVVLRTEIIPDPPVRGRYGYAFIPLKEGYTPIRQKPFVQHGERHEAHIKITEDHVERKFIERPPPGSFLEFLTRTFVVLVG